MFGWEIGFVRPWYLVLLALLPVLWVFSFRSLAGLGSMRRLVAIGLRSIVLALIVVCLAEIQLLRTSEKLTVIYLLDQSESIPRHKRQAMVDYVVQEVSKHRNGDREDRAGVIVFGADAKIEIPPFDDDLPTIGNIESYLELRTDATDISSALNLARASFPEDTARRVVIVTDGNENLGDARVVARRLAENGIGIDVVPVELASRAEVVVEKVTLPSDLRKGQTFESLVVLTNYAQPSDDNPEGLVKGKLRLMKRVANGDAQQVDEVDVTLTPGKNVVSFVHEIDRTAMYIYEARFIPDDPAQDFIQKNNSATAFTHVRGEGHVLFIVDSENSDEFDFLIGRMGEQKIEVTKQTIDELFSNAVELLQYDSVVLANVPRSSGAGVDDVSHFSDDQIRMLVRNTEQMGCGLVMIGGEKSFGAGGWTGSELEKAMPVDFQIQNDQIQAVGALVLMMHASEMAQGNHWQKVVGQEAIKALGPMDYCGLVHWNNQTGSDDWLWGKPRGLIRVGDQKNAMLARLGRMTPGDMPQFEPAMKLALAAFNRTNASVKHMIIISDGDPSPPTNQTIADYNKPENKITISTVAVGTHGVASSSLLQRIATSTGGKYYAVNNPKALPRIYQREVRRVAKPLIYDKEPVNPQITGFHEITKNLDQDSLRQLKGYVMTTKKENPLVEQLIVADQPDDGGLNSTILAAWRYGLGKTAVFTSDADNKWADEWVAAEYYDKFFGELIRWSMRPINSDANFSVATSVKDGKVKLFVTALDKNDEFLNFLDMSARALGPDLEPFAVEMRQVRPGRYVGEFDSTDAGSYLFNIMPGGQHSTIRGGVNVPYSSEYRERITNVALLNSLANLQPEGGEKGLVIEGDVGPGNVDRLLKVDTFRHNLPKAVSSQDMWPWVIVICAALFFCDVFIRRVTVGFEWLAPMIAWIRTHVFGRDAQPVADQRIERLRSQKEAVGKQLDQRRAAARFEPEPDDGQTAATTLDEVLDEVAGPASTTPSQHSPRTTMAPGEAEEESYTERLLKAKKKAFDKK